MFLKESHNLVKRLLSRKPTLNHRDLK